MKLKDFFYWGLIASMLVYVLYQKGIILTDFESIQAKQAYTFYHDNNTTFLDIREDEELKKEGRIAKSVHIPLPKLDKNIDKLNSYKAQKIVIFCRSGNRSIAASRLLSKHGFKVYNLKGGINAWKAQRLETF